MAIDIEKIVRNIVDKNYPSNPILLGQTNFVQIPVEINDLNSDITELDDGSGREYFLWGYSQWSGDDVISE